MRRTVPLLIVAALASGAAADDGALGRGPTVLTIPTAWTQPRTSLTAALDGDHRGGSGARITLGYARLVEVDLRGDGELTACAPCAGPARAVEPVRQPTAGWKLALTPWRDGAVAAGVRVPLGYRERARASEAFVVLSQRLGPVRLHAGASTWASAHRGADGGTVTRGPGASVRPLVGLEWTPEIYPRTTILADLQWLPQLGPTAAETAPRWAFAWGVRYRALAWSAIELGVRHREGDELGGATVMVRLSAAWPRATR
ncbi:MAG: hypothetical protein KA201_25095 [Kofleriaceae bacterium]|nr:hypothetical protein [Kofleriaceae bacterium]